MAPKVFVSHCNKDNEFTRRLVEDLRARGAEVWVDYEQIDSGDFAATINTGLGGCEWVILVLTANALASPWVPMEVNAAVGMKAAGSVKGVVPVVAGDFPPSDLPPLWRALHRYNAVEDYAGALNGLCKAFGVRGEATSGAAILTVHVSPSGAKVTVDGEEIQEFTSVPIGPSGRKTVVIEASKYGFLPERRDVELRSGEERTIEMTFVPKPMEPAQAHHGTRSHSNARLWLVTVGVMGVFCLVFMLLPKGSAHRVTRSKLVVPDGSASGSPKKVQSATTDLDRWSKGWVTDPPLTRHTDSVRSVAFSPKGSPLASGSDDKTIRLWNPKTGQPNGTPLTGHTGFVLCVAFSPDGSTLASACEDNTIRLWNPNTGQPIGSPLTGHTDFVISVAFSSDGSSLASGSLDKTVRLWNAKTGQQIGAPLTGHADSFYSVAFSSDGLMLAGGSRDKTIHLWNTKTGELMGAPLKGHGKQVLSVAFSPDGSTLASAGHDKTVRLWNAKTGQPIGAPLMGHTESIASITFSPDGSVLASGSYGKTVRLWNAKTGQPIGLPLTGHTSDVFSVAFSPDGLTLASGSADKTIRLWHPRP